jgi:hypothetical protein
MPSDRSLLSAMDSEKSCDSSGDVEPEPPGEFRDIESFFAYAEKGRFVALSNDNGKNWSYAVVTGKFENNHRQGKWRYSVDVDLAKDSPEATDKSKVIVTRDFELISMREWVPRLIVRPADESEVSRITFSYHQDSPNSQALPKAV